MSGALRDHATKPELDTGARPARVSKPEKDPKRGVRWGQLRFRDPLDANGSPVQGPLNNLIAQDPNSECPRTVGARGATRARRDIGVFANAGGPWRAFASSPFLGEGCFRISGQRARRPRIQGDPMGEHA